MTKYIILLVLVSLVGCTGDTLTFRHKGDAIIGKNSICIKSSPGDILEFYMLSYSLDNYRKPISVEDYISRKYPDTCIKVGITKPADYDFTYILNSKKYRLNFTVDKNGQIYKHNRE